MIKIQLETAVLKYDLSLERRLSIIKGNSGTGKTTIFELITGLRRN